MLDFFQQIAYNKLVIENGGVIMNALAEQNYNQPREIYTLIMSGMQQAQSGQLKDPDQVFERLEKKYNQLNQDDETV